MVGAYGGCSYQGDLGVVQQFLVAFRPLMSLPSMYTISAYGSNMPSRNGILLSATTFILLYILLQYYVLDSASVVLEARSDAVFR